jgi:hypothetical protein
MIFLFITRIKHEVPSHCHTDVPSKFVFYLMEQFLSHIRLKNIKNIYEKEKTFKLKHSNECIIS